MAPMRAHSAILLLLGAGRCVSLAQTKDSGDGEDRCAKYNYMFTSAYGDKKRKLCASEPGCVFVGDSRCGKCMNLDSYVNHINVSSSLPPPPPLAAPTLPIDDIIESINNSILSHDQASILKSMLVEGKERMERIADVESIVRDHISSSVADTLQQSQPHLNELAKSIVLELFADASNAHRVGELLQQLYEMEPLLTPAREQLYQYMTLSSTQTGLKAHMKQLRTRYLTSAEYQPVTADALGGVLRWWLGTPDCLAVVVPLLTWTLDMHKDVVIPLSQVTGEGLKQTQVATTDGLKWLALMGLQSEAAKSAAKDGLVDWLKNMADSTDKSSKNDDPPAKEVQ